MNINIKIIDDIDENHDKIDEEDDDGYEYEDDLYKTTINNMFYYYGF